MPDHLVATRLRSPFQVAAPQGRPRWKTPAALIVFQSENASGDRVIGGRRDESSLLRWTELLKPTSQLKLAHGTSEADIGCLAIDFSSATERHRQESDGVNRVALAAVVLADEDREIAA